MPQTSPPSSSGQQLTLVDVDTPVIDLTYRREADQRVVNRRKANYDPLRFEAPTLSARGGELYVVGGASTIALAKAMGDRQVYVRVLDGLSYEQEVQLYLDLNGGRTPLTAYQRHRALVAIKEPIALAIDRVLSAHGLAAASSSGKLTITAVSTLRYAWGAAGTARDRRVVSAQTLAEGERVLTWAVKSLLPLIAKGESATHVYSKLNLNAVIWLRRNAEVVPTAQTMATLLASDSVYSLRLALEDFDRSKRARNGTRLANHLNARSGAPVIVLPTRGDSEEG